MYSAFWDQLTSYEVTNLFLAYEIDFSFSPEFVIRY